MPHIVRSFILTPLIIASLLTLAFGIYWLSTDLPIRDWADPHERLTLPWAFAAYFSGITFHTYHIVLVIGVPTHLLLRRLDLSHWSNYVGVGIAASILWTVVMFFVIGRPYEGCGCEPSIFPDLGMGIIPLFFFVTGGSSFLIWAFAQGSEKAVDI